MMHLRFSRGDDDQQRQIARRSSQRIGYNPIMRAIVPFPGFL